MLLGGLLGGLFNKERDLGGASEWKHMNVDDRNFDDADKDGLHDATGKAKVEDISFNRGRLFKKGDEELTLTLSDGTKQVIGLEDGTAMYDVDGDGDDDMIAIMAGRAAVLYTAGAPELETEEDAEELPANEVALNVSVDGNGEAPEGTYLDKLVFDAGEDGELGTEDDVASIVDSDGVEVATGLEFTQQLLSEEGVQLDVDGDGDLDTVAYLNGLLNIQYKVQPTVVDAPADVAAEEAEAEQALDA